MGREVSLDAKLHQLLRDLRRALTDAIADSSDVSRSLRQIREEGYALYFMVDCKREANDPEALALTPGRRISRSATALAATSAGTPATPAKPATPATAAPSFQIDSRDLSFLRSIGIDPTRRLRRRRTTSV